TPLQRLPNNTKSPSVQHDSLIAMRESTPDPKSTTSWDAIGSAEHYPCTRRLARAALTQRPAGQALQGFVWHSRKAKGLHATTRPMRATSPVPLWNPRASKAWEYI